jgi:hypothetical protein
MQYICAINHKVIESGKIEEYGDDLFIKYCCWSLHE